MRFELIPFGGRAPERAAACDGLVPGACIDLSHWRHNRTPAHLKADTSVEIALNFAAERAAHDVEIAANNHFDADGVLAVWSLLRPELALAHRGVIVAAAEAGDFDAWPADDRGLWLESAIARMTAAMPDAKKYARTLAALDTLVPAIAARGREDLWGENFAALLTFEPLLASGAIAVSRVGKLAIISHAPGVAELPGAWIARLAGDAEGLLLAFADPLGGFRYRYELPRWTWADTVVRPQIAMPRRGPIRARLGPSWIIKGRQGMTGVAYTDVPVATPPQNVAAAINEVTALPAAA